MLAQPRISHAARALVRWPISAVATLALVTLLFCGCGGNGNPTGFDPPADTGQTGVTATAASAPTTGDAALVVKAPSSIVAHQPVRDWMGELLSLVSSPAEAATVPLSTLSNASVRVFNSAAQLITSGFTDSNGKIFFYNLTPGTYTFLVTKTVPGGIVQLAGVGVISSGSVLTFELNPTTTAMTYVIQAQATNGNILGSDVGAFSTLSTGNNSLFNQLLADITAQIQAGQALFNTSNLAALNPGLFGNANTTGQQIFTVVFRYPAPYQVGVKRSGPIAVAFNKAVNVAQIPPTYTDWTVTHKRVTSGQTVTIDNNNFSQFGTWSYSDSAQVVNGVSLPPHALVFSLTSQQMAANSREIFSWRFGAAPQAADTTPMTLGPGVSPNVFLDLTFYTGSN